MRREERIGLGIAAALHAALVVAFLLQPETRDAIEPTQRMTVNLASEVGLEAAAPEPVAESRASIAPTIANEPAPAPQPADIVPQPIPQPRIERPVAATRPAPTRAATPPDARQRRRPDTPAATRPQPPARTGGGSRVGDNFLAGMGNSTRTSETRAPASTIGASERASLLQAITRQVREHRQPLSGPDIDLLVTKVRFRLNPDGSLAGAPQVLGQRGENETNRAQAPRHAEQAIRAIRLAAPFDLPEQYYSAWRTVTLDFDWKLAQ